MPEQQPQQQSKASSAKEITLGLVVLAVLAAGAIWGLTAWLGGDDSSNSDNGSSELTADEQAYVDAAYDAVPALRGLGDDDVLDVGRAICDDLDAGYAPAEVAADLRGTDGPFADAPSEIVGAAELHLCDV